MASPFTDPAVLYSRDAAHVVNSVWFYAKPIEERLALAERFTMYETLNELPPDLRKEFEEGLSSPLYFES
jgi:hypothetical protein